jgi:hypothetical protein
LLSEHETAMLVIQRAGTVGGAGSALATGVSMQS